MIVVLQAGPGGQTLAPALMMGIWGSFMPWCPGDSLVIGVSSRAVFNLDEEDAPAVLTAWFAPWTGDR